MPVRHGKIDQSDLAVLDDLPGRLNVRRNAQLHGKDIDCSNGKNAEIDGSVVNAVDDLVDGPVSTRRHDGLKSLLDCPFCFGLGVSGSFRKLDDRSAGDLLHFFDKLPRPFAFRGRI